MHEQEKYYVDEAKKGNIEAFEKLVESHQKKIYNIAFKLIGNREDALEIAQEALIKIYRAIKNFQGKSSFSTWIYRITTNVCLDYLRKTKNNRTVVSINEKVKFNENEISMQIEDTKLSPNHISERKEFWATISMTLQKIPEEQKVVIVLRDIHGFSYSEIAKNIKCPEGTVKSRLNRGRLLLKDLLKKNNPELFTDKSV